MGWGTANELEGCTVDQDALLNVRPDVARYWCLCRGMLVLSEPSKSIFPFLQYGSGILGASGKDQVRCGGVIGNDGDCVNG